MVTTPVMEENDTDVKLATLASIYDGIDPSILLEALIAANGSVEDAVNALSIYREEPRHKCAPAKAVGYQSSLDSFRLSDRVAGKATKPLTRKGQTVHLYTPDDVAAHTPCSIIHNFLSTEEANNLLKELLAEAPTFERQSFKVFDNVVQSPHSACFYVDSIEEKRKQLTEYLYNGSHLTVRFASRVVRCSKLTFAGRPGDTTSHARSLEPSQGSRQSLNRWQDQDPLPSS